MQLEKGEESEEVSFTPVAQLYALFDQAQTRKPRLTDVTSHVDLVTQVTVVIKGQKETNKIASQGIN